MGRSEGESSLKRFTPEAAEAMQAAIADAGGNEVLFAGELDADGRVGRVRVCARGNQNAVNALFAQLNLRDVVIHNHPSGDLTPSDADLSLAGAYSGHGHGMFIIDNDVTRVYVVVEPFRPDQEKRLSHEEATAYLGPESKLAHRLPRYEERPQQLEMVKTVVDAFNRNAIAAIEAPTGVGKTFAYLLPAILWALQNRERVVVSTRTINLQEQIIEKDVPLLQECLDKRFSACLVKGRGNYLCLRKLDRAFSELTLLDTDAQKAQLNAVADWANKTVDGSLSDLPFVPDRDLWAKVCSEADTCSFSRCPNQQKCFVGRARREMAKADLLVVNHHMLFSDIAVKTELGDFTSVAVLPAYARLILDEAHNLEDSATEYFGVNASLLGIQTSLGRFLQRDRGRERGLLPLVLAKVMKDCPQVLLPDFERFQKLVYESLYPALGNAREAAADLFGALREYVAEECREVGRDIKWRLTEPVLAEPEVREMHRELTLPAVDALRQVVRLATQLARLMAAIEPKKGEDDSPLADDVIQVTAYAKRLELAANTLAECTSEEIAPNTVRWVEINSQNPRIVRVVRCPLEVAEPLAERLYRQVKTVVLTSATLTIERRFDYLFQRLGLDLLPRERLLKAMLESPFDFERQAMLGVAEDMPAPSESGFLEDAADAIYEVLQITGGRAFVLFTSYAALDRTHRMLEGRLRQLGIPALRQGQATRTQLLQRFRSDPHSVLFGTDSFWEGVDVAGEALQCVILPRLPFRVPTEPIQQARAEAIEERGGNAFMRYSVPQAVIKFRQGFGRLIRSRGDFGAVVVLDCRTVTKYYGRIFLDSLPNLRILRGSRQEMNEALAAFFEEHRRNTT